MRTSPSHVLGLYKFFQRTCETLGLNFHIIFSSWKYDTLCTMFCQPMTLASFSPHYHEGFMQTSSTCWHQLCRWARANPTTLLCREGQRQRSAKISMYFVLFYYLNDFMRFIIYIYINMEFIWYMDQCPIQCYIEKNENNESNNKIHPPNKNKTWINKN